MIFLLDNVLLQRKLTHGDVKPRLLGASHPPLEYKSNTRDLLTRYRQGHWGTCPGLILVYSHLNLLISRRGLDMLYVVGPGHGAPAILSSLWLEGSLEKFYPDYARNNEGLRNLISNFSTPSGFPR